MMLQTLKYLLSITMGINTVLSTIQSLYESCNVKVSISVIDDHSTDESVNLIKVNIQILLFMCYHPIQKKQIF